MKQKSICMKQIIYIVTACVFVLVSPVKAQRIYSLKDCLEEGLTPKQILEFADPNFSVNVMRRLKQLQQRGGKCGDIERIGR